MIFSSITRPSSLKKGEMVKVRLFEGKEIVGYVFSVENDNFWLVPEKDSQYPFRFSFKIDQVYKMN